jgi:alpha-tubulin suppressor-like RCC1 family protein
MVRGGWRSLAEVLSPGFWIAGLVALLLGAVGSVSVASAEEISGDQVLGMGHNGEAELGLGFQSGDEVAADTMPGMTHVLQVSIGFNFGVAVVTNGTRRWAVSWGENNKGQLGNGSEHESEPQELAEPIEALASGVEEVAAAGDHAMALKEGHVYTWGITQVGESGNGYPTEKQKDENEVSTTRATPEEVKGLSNIVAIATGGTTDYAVTSSGEVLAWGEDTYGQAGAHNVKQESGEGVCAEGGTKACLCRAETQKTSETSCVTTPVYIAILAEHLKGVVSIQAGEQSAYASTGQTAEHTQLLSWGTNETGELGRSAEFTKYHPWPLHVLLPAGELQQVEPGSHQVLALLGGQVYGWGTNGETEINDLLGTTENTSELIECGSKAKCFNKPVHLASLGTATAVGAGKATSYVIKAGEVYAWGLNTWGQLGINKTSEAVTPTVASPTLVKGAEGNTIQHALRVFGSEQRAAIMVEEGAAPPPTISTENTVESELYDSIKVNWTFNFTPESGVAYKVRLCSEENSTCHEAVLAAESSKTTTFHEVPRHTKWQITIRPDKADGEKDKILKKYEPS